MRSATLDVVASEDQKSEAWPSAQDQLRIERALPWVRDRKFAEQAAAIMRAPDEALVAVTIDAGTIQPSRQYTMEMQRRLKVATEANTAELVRFRQAADVAAGKSDRAAGRLERLTWALIVLTLAVVALTVVLVVKG